MTGTKMTEPDTPTRAEVLKAREEDEIKETRTHRKATAVRVLIR